MGDHSFAMLCDLATFRFLVARSSMLGVGQAWTVHILQQDLTVCSHCWGFGRIVAAVRDILKIQDFAPRLDICLWCQDPFVVSASVR